MCPFFIHFLILLANMQIFQGISHSPLNIFFKASESISSNKGSNLFSTQYSTPCAIALDSASKLVVPSVLLHLAKTKPPL